MEAFVVFSFVLFWTGSHVLQSLVTTSLSLRLVLPFPSSCFHCLDAGVTGIHHSGLHLSGLASDSSPKLWLPKPSDPSSSHLQGEMDPKLMGEKVAIEQCWRGHFCPRLGPLACFLFCKRSTGVGGQTAWAWGFTPNSAFKQAGYFPVFVFLPESQKDTCL